MDSNPFNPSGFAIGDHFTNRTKEVEWLVNGAKRHAKQLLYGKRRMGKSSCLLRAAEILKTEDKCEVFYVDLSRYASLVDAANALLLTASPVIHGWGGKWLHQLATLMKSVSLKLGVLSLDVDVRSKDRSEQQQGFIDILDSLNVVAEKRKAPIVVAIDEFQDIIRLGADRAEWSLRSVLQSHATLGYFLAGSEERLIEQMTGNDGAFYELLETMLVGPIPALELAAWIDTKFRVARVNGKGVGEACVKIAGDRTRDAVDLARRTFDIGLQTRSADATTVHQALVALVADKEDPFFRLWSGLPAAQQSVLQAVGQGHGSSLGAAHVRRRYGFKSTGEPSMAAVALIEKGHLHRLGRGSFEFDSPFFKEWILATTIPQVEGEAQSVDERRGSRI